MKIFPPLREMLAPPTRTDQKRTAATTTGPARSGLMRIGQVRGARSLFGISAAVAMIVLAGGLYFWPASGKDQAAASKGLVTDDGINCSELVQNSQDGVTQNASCRAFALGAGRSVSRKEVAPRVGLMPRDGVLTSADLAIRPPTPLRPTIGTARPRAEAD